MMACMSWEDSGQRNTGTGYPQQANLQAAESPLLFPVMTDENDAWPCNSAADMRVSSPGIVVRDSSI